ncbi:MAG: DUF5074 domain-containing protein, partial [Bacteroidota bacterium]
MNRLNHFFWGFFLLLVLATACSEETTPDPIDPPVIQPEAGVLISNEGGFGFNNASLSFYHFTDQTVSNQLFQNANDRPMGDVLQSITLHEEKLYLVMNNSNKIEVVDPETFQTLSTISPFNSPRYLLPLDNQKAYLTDLYEDKMYVVDLANERINTTIELEGWTEELLLFQDRVFVSNRESKYVFVI